MAGETVITIVGNLVDDPEMRYTASGVPVANFRIASTPRTYDKSVGEWRDGDTLYMSCAAWRQLGENAAESLTRGTRVIVTGRLQQRTYEDRQGTKRTAYQVIVDDVGPSLRTATARINRPTREHADNDAQQRPAQQQPAGWSVPNDEPPF